MVVSNKLLKKRRAERNLPKTKKSPKNRIRDLKRQLGRADGEKAAALQEQIDALTACETAASVERRRVETEKKYATKYHKVKFFERRKIDRKLAQARREKDAELEEKLLRDLDYVKFYPKGKKYISLFVERDEDPKTPRLREKMRALALEAAAAHSSGRDERSLAEEEDDDAEKDDDEDDYFVTI